MAKVLPFVGRAVGGLPVGFPVAAGVTTTFRGKRWARAYHGHGYLQLWADFGPFTVFIQATCGYAKDYADCAWNWRLNAFGQAGVFGGESLRSFAAAAKHANRALDRLVRDLKGRPRNG